jgi:hypothetical protein
MPEPESQDPIYGDSQRNSVAEHDIPSGISQLSQHTVRDSGDILAGAMRDLSLQANGGFVGASAYLGLGRAVSSILGAMEASPLELPSNQHSISLDRLLTSTASGQYPNNTP